MFGNMKELLEPIGQYKVGMKRFDFVDSSRTQVFSFEEKDAPRKIPIIVYYPSDDVGNMKTASYVSKEEAKLISKQYYHLFPKSVFKVKTHLYENASISDKEDKYQLILFNHGYGAYMQNSTILLSNLASLGYIVVSIGHPYEAAVVKYLDHTLIKYHPSHRKLLRISKEGKLMYKEKYKGVKFTTDEECLEYEKDFHSWKNPKINEHVQIWVDDTNFIADTMEKINTGEIDSIFKGKLKLDRGIGLMGHSYGGSTAGQACWKEDRYACGINIDCGTTGQYGFQDIQTPFMSIGAPYLNFIGKSTFLNNSKDSYLVLLKNTKHLDFVDALFIARTFKLLGALGKRDKFETSRIMTTYITDFFDKYLKGNQDIKLEELQFDGVDFEQNSISFSSGV